MWVTSATQQPYQPRMRRQDIALYVISDRGEVATRYDKQFCSHTEITDWHTPGRECCVFEAGGWRFGQAVATPSVSGIVVGLLDDHCPR